MGVVRTDYATVVSWVSHPFHAVLLVAFLVATFYHAILGLQVVIEDYIHDEGTKIASLLFMKFALVLLGGSAVLAVLRIAIGGMGGTHG
jgi:succinate dehydrogenase / fumarate reductase membrane anchor subunit